jgi:hypothetical protein
MPLARADLESLLRTRHLDRTLTTALLPPDAREGDEPARPGGPGVPGVLDERFPRGHLSEIVGPQSSGRTSLLLRLLAAASGRGELVALVDTLDMLDVASAEAAGVELTRLLWIRGHVVPNPGMCRDLNQRALEQALRALTLVLQAGNFGLVAFDAGDAPADALRRLPFTTWLRLQRLVEGRQTICVLLGSEPMARSSAGLTVRLGQAGRTGQAGRASLAHARPGGARAEAGIRFTERLFTGLDIEGRMVRARGPERRHEDAHIGFSTRVSPSPCSHSNFPTF